MQAHQPTLVGGSQCGYVGRLPVYWLLCSSVRLPHRLPPSQANWSVAEPPSGHTRSATLCSLSLIFIRQAWQVLNQEKGTSWDPDQVLVYTEAIHCSLCQVCCQCSGCQAELLHCKICSFCTLMTHISETYINSRKRLSFKWSPYLMRMISCLVQAFTSSLPDCYRVVRINFWSSFRTRMSKLVIFIDDSENRDNFVLKQPRQIVLWWSLNPLLLEWMPTIVVCISFFLNSAQVSTQFCFIFFFLFL